MDQVKTIALVVWQQRFWVLSGISIIVAFICWNKATTDLESRFSQRKTAIENSFTAVQSIQRDNPFHPNDNVNQGDEEQIEVQKSYVGQLWFDLYEQQKTKVLFWPELGDGFAARMAEKKFRDDISIDMRDTYRDYIKSQFDSLRKIVKANTNTKLSRVGNKPGAPGDKVKKDYLVNWADQSNLLRRLTINATPSATRVWVTQEDIWVFTTLLKVIGKTNERHGATRPDNTAISTILNLQVGKNASESNLREASIFIPKAEGERNKQLGTKEIPIREGSAEPEEQDVVLLADRYLSPDGTPYPGESRSFGKEYRKLPIHMVLKMDQRAIPLVLVECANAPLPIEVTRLSVNRSKSNTDGFSSRSSAWNKGRASGSKGNDGDDQRELSEVDIQGVVLIYEPPDESVVPVPEEKPTT